MINVRRLIRITISTILVISLGLSLAFDPPPRFIYPMEGYYALAGTFGELRTDHFHGGIDIKTHQKIGVPIRAVAAGYVCRVMTKTYGFGKALYLRHPDGTYTAYAHLSRFREDLDAYLYQAQKADGRYYQNLFPEPDRFPVKQGDVIAYSGNSGSSYGPHLHFEWRDSLERPMNSLLPFLENVEDRTPPYLQHIALEPLDLDSRVQGAFARKEWVVLGANGQYRLSDTLNVQGRVGLSYRGFDRLEGAPNKCGINKARLYLDEDLHFEHDLTRFSFDDTRQINIHMDYGEWKRSARRFVRAYVEPGNTLDIYPQTRAQGTIQLPDSQPHQIRLELEDAHGNVTRFSGVIQQRAVSPEAERWSDDFEVTTSRGMLKVLSRNPAAKLAMRSPGGVRSLEPAYHFPGGTAYLVPLAAGNLPELIWEEGGDWRWQSHFRAELLPHRHQTVDWQEAKLFFPMRSLFRPYVLPVEVVPPPAAAYTAVYRVGDPGVPILKPYSISFAPPAGVSGLVVATRDRRGNWEYAGNTRLPDGRIAAEVKHFGEFCLMQDLSPPQLRPHNFTPGGTLSGSNTAIRVKVEERFSGINDYEAKAWLDGAWALIEYNFKRDEFIHELREPLKPGKHTFRLRVPDDAGNVADETYTFVR